MTAMGNRKPPPQGLVIASPLWVLLLILAALFFFGANASNSDWSVLVVGRGDCTDCVEKKIEKTHALAGLKVTIECKAPNGEVKTRGASVLHKDGEFRVELSGEVVDHAGILKEECHVQFHSASKQPCPAHNGLEKSSKIIFKSNEENGKKLILTTVGKMNINPELCSSDFLWHYYQHPPLPPFPKTYYTWPKPPFPYYHPIYKMPLPPPVYSTTPVYSSPVPVYNPPVPVYKPPVPVYQPPGSVYSPPYYKKPCPPFPKLPPWTPIYQKPWPPLPHHGWPPLPKHPWLPPSKP